MNSLINMQKSIEMPIDNRVDLSLLSSRFVLSQFVPFSASDIQERFRMLYKLFSLIFIYFMESICLISRCENPWQINGGQNETIFSICPCAIDRIEFSMGTDTDVWLSVLATQSGNAIEFLAHIVTIETNIVKYFYNRNYLVKILLMQKYIPIIMDS